MPILSRSNNRVLPANERTSDVARKAIDDLKVVERNRYHNAFKVQGSQGILYHALTCGMQCHCKATGKSVQSRLNLDGTASAGFLNSMLTGGLDFGVLPYGLKPADSPTYDPNATPRAVGSAPLTRNTGVTNDFFTLSTALVDYEPTVNASISADDDLPAMYTADGITPLRNTPGTPSDSYTNDPINQPGATVVANGVGPNGPVGDLEFETLIDRDNLGGITDANCPVCMGTGYVGGFSVLNGWRQVLTHQAVGSTFTGPGVVNLEETVPSVECMVATFPVLLPAHAVGVDALRVWNVFQVVSPVIKIDGVVLRSQQELMRFCDGRQHTLTLEFAEPSRFTHVELQVNQSLDSYLFDLPKTTKNNMRTMLQNMQDMQILVSPKVPLIRPGDFIAESTYNTVLAVSSVPAWNDNKRTVLGWECEVRPTQPQELYSLLPRRRPLAVPNSPPLVKDNMHGHRRT